MLCRFNSLDKIQFSQLTSVYAESILSDAEQMYKAMDHNAALLLAEQDLYAYLNEVFFTTQGAWYAVWCEQGQYRCALRIEPYQDGFLMAALETSPGFRRMGYAKMLIMAVLKGIDKPLYSHVDKQNLASVELHRSCGFECIRDTAVYLDGTVVSTSYTFRRMPVDR